MCLAITQVTCWFNFCHSKIPVFSLLWPLRSGNSATSLLLVLVYPGPHCWQQCLWHWCIVHTSMRHVLSQKICSVGGSATEVLLQLPVVTSPYPFFQLNLFTTCYTNSTSTITLMQATPLQDASWLLTSWHPSGVLVWAVKLVVAFLKFQPCLATSITPTPLHFHNHPLPTLYRLLV